MALPTAVPFLKSQETVVLQLLLAKGTGDPVPLLNAKCMYVLTTTKRMQRCLLILESFEMCVLYEHFRII